MKFRVFAEKADEIQLNLENVKRGDAVGSTMKRCGVFVFYNQEGIVEEYVIWLLDSLIEILDKLVIVINGNIQKDSLKKLEKYTDNIFQRDNKGYDAGAYKDTFLCFLKDQDWHIYDELLLINNTFYGPFYSWKEVFQTMEQNNYDFWGLSKSKVPFKETEFVDSYFIVIKKEMFCADCFKTFWSKLEYYDNFLEAIENFEWKFTKFFIKHGYKMGVLVNQSCYTKVGELITKFNFPILKRKACGVHYYKEIKDAYAYLERNGSYPLWLIEEDRNKRKSLGLEGPYCVEKLLNFCEKFESIYIYGAGGYAENITYFLKVHNIVVSGYIVSNSNMVKDKIYAFEEFDLPKDAGIIIGMGYSNYMQIKDNINRVYEKHRVFVPEYGF